MASIVPKECDLVIVGKTGTGKSSVGNSLLGHTVTGKKQFESKKAAKSVTVHCSRKTGNLKDGTILTIVDTPGLFDTGIPNEETMKEIIKCIALCAPGPHVILFILSLNRFTKEEMDTMQMLKELFGTMAMKHVIVVFTGKDGLDEDDEDVDDFIEHSPYLQNLLKECDSRYVGISNTLSSPTHDSDVKDVMKLIYKTMEQNGNQVYSQEAFSKAEGIVKEEIEIRKREEGIIERRKHEEENIERRKQREKEIEQEEEEFERRRQEEEFESREREKEIESRRQAKEGIQRKKLEEEEIQRRKQEEEDIQRRKQEEGDIRRKRPEKEDIECRKHEKIEFERRKQIFEDKIEKMREETLEKEELENKRRLRLNLEEVYRRKLRIEEEEMQRRKQRSEEEETEWKRLQETRIREEIMKDIESNDDDTLSKLSRGLNKLISHAFKRL